MLERDRLDEAVVTLGALLQERGKAIGVLIVGGGNLLLLGVVERPTADVDVVGFSSAAGYARADVLSRVSGRRRPRGWRRPWARRLVAQHRPCRPDRFGLPPGLEERVMVRSYGGLEVHLPAREDLVCFKLYAAVDHGERSKHFADLRSLSPTPHQLLNATRWARTHDPSTAFLRGLQRILRLLDMDVLDGDL